MAGLIYLHGGGWTAGGLADADLGCPAMAAQAGIAVLAVDYRLSPEYPYPAALDDCEAALNWITGPSAARFGVSPGHVGVLGESAGGGLAASLALRERDKGRSRLAAQFLDAPTVDDRGDTHSMRNLPDAPIWNSRNTPVIWRHYLGAAPGSPDVPLYAAPGRAAIPDLAGVPRAWVTCYPGGSDTD